MAKKKGDRIDTGELTKILEWREGEPLSYRTIAELVKVKFDKNITKQGVRYLCEKYSSEEERKKVKKS